MPATHRRGRLFHDAGRPLPLVARAENGHYFGIEAVRGKATGSGKRFLPCDVDPRLTDVLDKGASARLAAGPGSTISLQTGDSAQAVLQVPLKTPAGVVGFLSADRQKATLVVFFLISSVVTVIAHGSSGLVTGEVLRWFLWSTPLLVVGTQIGAWMYLKLGQREYRHLTFVLVLATGVLLILRSLGVLR